MFAVTDASMAHCTDRALARVIEPGGERDDAGQLLWRVLQLLNSSVPDTWALTRHDPNFVIRVMKSPSRKMKCDMLVLGTTYRSNRSLDHGLYHLIRTVYNPTMISRDGRRALKGILGSYVPEEFGRALANRPNLYVFIEDPPLIPFYVWMRDEIFVPFLRASDYWNVFDRAVSGKVACSLLYEIHLIRPVTTLGQVSEVQRLIKLHFDGSIGFVRFVPADFAPQYHYQFAPVPPHDRKDVRPYADLVVETMESQKVELEAKYSATNKQLEKCDDLLTSYWKVEGSCLRLPSADWILKKPESKRRQYRYFDTPTLLLRNSGSGIRVRRRDDGIVFTIKVPIAAIAPQRFEWEALIEGVQELDDVTESHLWKMTEACLREKIRSEKDKPYLATINALVENQPPLVEVLQLDIELLVWTLANKNGGHSLISLDRVKVMSDKREVTSFQEIEIECVQPCSRAAWSSLCDYIKGKLELNKLIGSSKYERALSLLANR